MQEFIAYMLAPTMALLGQIIIVLFLTGYVLNKFNVSFMDKVNDYVKQYGGWFAFLAALGATLGSLFYSEVMGYTPCPLCWWQRIFMYPLVLILLIALIVKDKKVTRYVIPMSIIGALIALWHYIEQMTAVALCTGDLADCSIRYTLHYGYITIPLMALTAFILIILFSLAWGEKPFSKKIRLK